MVKDRIVISKILNNNREIIDTVIDFPNTGIVYEYNGSSEDDESLRERVQYAIKYGGYKTKTIDGIEYKVVQGTCKGCFQCPVEACNSVKNLNQKRINCVAHGETLVKKTCSVKFYFFKQINATKQFMYSVGTHEHNNPPPRKISSKEKESLVIAFSDNPTLTAKDVSLGIGVPQIPASINRAMANISRIQTIRRKTLKTDNEGVDLPILHLLRSEKKLHGKLASAMSEEAKEGTNQWVRKIVLLEGKTLGLCMFPIVTMILNQDVEFLVFDLKHKSASGPFYHHFGMSTFVEGVEGGFCLQLARVILENETYEEAFQAIFDTIEEDGGNLSSLFVGENRKIKAILVDFSQSQLKAFKATLKLKFGDELGERTANELLSGCLVHFKRSVKRMAKVIPIDECYKKHVEALAAEIEFQTTKEDIKRILSVIAMYCPGVKSWSDWWSRDHILNLLLGTSSVENNLPRNTNVQEVLNATVVPTHNGNASIETTIGKNFKYKRTKCS